MKMVQVQNGKIIQYKLPKVGVLKDGSTVSGYDLLPSEILLDEGWLPLEDIRPIFDENTQYAIDDGYKILTDKIIKKYKIGKIINKIRFIALQSIDGKCSTAIYSGVTVGDKHYKLTATAQGNLATAQAKVDGGVESVIYAADNEEPTLHTAEQITAISDAAYKWGIVNTSYYAKLQKWIVRETDEKVLQAIDYGVKLPDDLMQELSTLLAGAGINLADYAGLLG